MELCGASTDSTPRARTDARSRVRTSPIPPNELMLLASWCWAAGCQQGDGIEDAGFARAVGADQDLKRPQLEVDIEQTAEATDT